MKLECCEVLTSGECSDAFLTSTVYFVLIYDGHIHKDGKRDTLSKPTDWCYGVYSITEIVKWSIYNCKWHTAKCVLLSAASIL